MQEANETQGSSKPNEMGQEAEVGESMSLRGGEASQVRPLVVLKSNLGQRSTSFQSDIEIITVGSSTDTLSESPEPAQEKEDDLDVISDDESSEDESSSMKFRQMCDAAESRRVNRCATPHACYALELPPANKSKLWQRRRSENKISGPSPSMMQ